MGLLWFFQLMISLITIVNVKWKIRWNEKDKKLMKLVESINRNKLQTLILNYIITGVGISNVAFYNT